MTYASFSYQSEKQKGLRFEICLGHQLCLRLGDTLSVEDWQAESPITEAGTVSTRQEPVCQQDRAGPLQSANPFAGAVEIGVCSSTVPLIAVRARRHDRSPLRKSMERYGRGACFDDANIH